MQLHSNFIAFSFRGSQHQPTGKIPFEMMFEGQLTLLIQLRISSHHLQEIQYSCTDEVNDKDDSQPPPSQEAMLQCMAGIQNQIHIATSINIAAIQAKQARVYDL